MNKGKKKLSILLLILLLLGLLTAAVLASRLGNLNKKKDDGTVTIPIGDDAKKVSEADEDAPLEAEIKVESEGSIFRVSYDTGRVTVFSSNGEKLVAPGTKWNYKFKLINTKNTTLDYELYVSATVEGLEDQSLLPITARLKGPEKWVVGGAKEYVPLLDVNKIRDVGVLAADHSASYSFGWQWPFEGDDELDTMLGNMTVEEPIRVKILIWVYAWTDEIPDKPGGDPPSPPTGDDFNIGLWMSVMIISLFVFVAVLGRDKKKRFCAREAILMPSGANEDQRE